MTARYAIYAAPAPATPLWRFGSQLIGYDAATGATDTIIPEHFDADEWAKVTEAPRLYGFHATMKAPFRLAPGHDEPSLMAAFAAFCATQTAVALADIRPAIIGRSQSFLALVPNSQTAALHALEKNCVLAFESCRAALSEADIARRDPQRLSPIEHDQLLNYGYPYIFALFRLHYSLTGRLNFHQSARALDSVTALYAPLATEMTWLDRLCLFRQSAPDERFRIIASADLARPAADVG